MLEKAGSRYVKPLPTYLRQDVGVMRVLSRNTLSECKKYSIGDSGAASSTPSAIVILLGCFSRVNDAARRLWSRHFNVASHAFPPAASAAGLRHVSLKQHMRTASEVTCTVDYDFHGRRWPERPKYRWWRCRCGAECMSGLRDALTGR